MAKVGLATLHRFFMRKLKNVKRSTRQKLPIKGKRRSAVECADSMAQAAAMVAEPLAVLQAAKDSGCQAFRGGRVYVKPLREWMAANGERVRMAILAADAEQRTGKGGKESLAPGCGK